MRPADQAAKGNEFVIAKVGKPMVRVMPIEPVPGVRSLGFLTGQGAIEADGKAAFARDIDAIFGGGFRGRSMLLLDIRLVPWAAVEAARLSTRAARTLASREVPLAFSIAMLWEIAIQTSLGRPDFAVDPGLLHKALLAEGVIELPIRAPHVLRVATLPWIHRDPFDSLLVAQALEDGLTLLTADATLKRYRRVVKAA